MDSRFAGNVAAALEALHRSVPPRTAMMNDVVRNLRPRARADDADDVAATEDLIAFARRRRLRNT